MADISSLLANAAQTNADFSAIPKLWDTYYKGQEQAYQQAGRDLFKGGVPTTNGQPDGPPDFAAIGKMFFQHGDATQGVAAYNLGLQQSKLKFGQDADAAVNPPSNGAQPPIVGPSTSRNSVTIDPSKRSDTTTAPQPAQQPQQQPTVMTVLAAQGIPNDQLGAASASVARQLGVDPSEPLDMQDQRVRNVIIPAIQRLKQMGLGQVVPQGQPSPAPQAVPQQPQVAQAAPQGQPQGQPAPQGFPPQSGATDPRFVGLVPAGRSPELQVHLLQRAIDSGLLPPEQAKSYQSAIDAIQKAAQPTDDMKAAASVGQNVAEFNRSKEETKNDVVRYGKQAEGIDAAAAAATSMLPHLQLARSLMSQPSFYSGTGEPLNLAYKRAIAAFGGDPNASLPQEGFRKVMAANILDQVAQLKAETAASGGSTRIFQSQIALMEKAAQNPDNSIAANRLLTEMGFRAAKRAQDIANMADNYNGGHLNPQFNMKLRQWNADHPMFTPEEMADPRLIAPPEFKDARSAFDAKLPKGTPLKIAGKLKWVQ